MVAAANALLLRQPGRDGRTAAVTAPEVQPAS
jgi:hypothetical protein